MSGDNRAMIDARLRRDVFPQTALEAVGGARGTGLLHTSVQEVTLTSAAMTNVSHRSYLFGDYHRWITGQKQYSSAAALTVYCWSTSS